MEDQLKIIQAKKRIGIGVRLAIMIATLLVLATGSFTFLSLMSQRRNAMDLFMNNSFHMGRSLERLLRLSMLENRRSEIDLAIQQMAMEDIIEEVSLVNHAGEVIYSGGTDARGQVSLDDARCSGCHGQDKKAVLRRLPELAGVALEKNARVARVSLPVYNAPECFTSACHVHSESESVLGVMQLDVSYAEIDRSLSQSHRNLIALSISIALATSLIVLELIRRWVVVPVRDLVKGTRRVADGDLGHVIPVGEAELGALAHSFNRMQDQLQSSQRQLIMIEKLASIGKLSASVAHEINNPLTGVLTFAEDLIDESEPDDPRRPDYEVIRREALRCRQIVRQLLDFSRQDRPNMRPIDMNEVLTNMVAFVSKQTIYRNIKTETDLQENLPHVIADPVQLEQVILGILVNASEAMPEGGTIYIKSSSLEESREVEVSLRDTGPGISEENLERIFEPFFSTKGGKSMGIGLGVSSNIISQHGGRLEAESPPGEGATFKIIIPWAGSVPLVTDTQRI